MKFKRKNGLNSFINTEITSLNSSDEDLIDLFTVRTERKILGAPLFTDFWTSMKQEYLSISGLAIKNPLQFPFSTIWLSETGFSAMVSIKTKQQLLYTNFDTCMYLALNKNILPNFDPFVNDIS